RRGPGPTRRRTRSSRRRGGRISRPALRSARPGHRSRLTASGSLGIRFVVAQERPPLARDGVSHRTQDRELATRYLGDEPPGAFLVELRARRRGVAPNVQPCQVVSVHAAPDALEQLVRVDQPKPEQVPVGIAQQPIALSDQLIGQLEEALPAHDRGATSGAVGPGSRAAHGGEYIHLLWWTWWRGEALGSVRTIAAPITQPQT